jgi:hypothetical protein
VDVDVICFVVRECFACGHNGRLVVGAWQDVMTIFVHRFEALLSIERSMSCWCDCTRASYGLGWRGGVGGSFEPWAHSRFPHVLEAIGHAWIVTKITRDRGYLTRRTTTPSSAGQSCLFCWTATKATKASIKPQQCMVVCMYTRLVYLPYATPDSLQSRLSRSGDLQSRVFWLGCLSRRAHANHFSFRQASGPPSSTLHAVVFRSSFNVKESKAAFPLLYCPTYPRSCVGPSSIAIITFDYQS